MDNSLKAERTETGIALCYHCGNTCDDVFWSSEKPFCCYGCKTVFEILNENNLCVYYTLNENSGVSGNSKAEVNFSYLDETSTRKKILTFDSGDYATVEFYIPAIHCVSCIFLLENLQKINRSILRSEVNFPRKTVSLHFDPLKIKLSEIASLISSLGYSPEITLDENSNTKQPSDTSLVLKLAIAGFCFGNVMLFSFPEYLGLSADDRILMRLFSWLNVGLSVPVFFFSASDYFRSGLKSFRQHQINIDVPIALGLVALFLRSLYDILSATGPGYLDSFTGLVFFLLVGRWFQSKTYESLSFDRDFKSYFPLSVNKRVDQDWKPVVIHDLKVNDEIRIRNMEIIPADSRLRDTFAYIDYSFVTGESKPVRVSNGEMIYAGGRLIGNPVILVVCKKVSQSHLTSLWNHPSFKKINHSKYQKIIDVAAQKFTWGVMGIALATAIYWQMTTPEQMWLVLTSVLMVACPCALALAAPFTYGSMLRVFGHRKLYLKNADVIERLASIDMIVFDKTGTITTGQNPEIIRHGDLTVTDLEAIKVLTNASTHPLSLLITKSIHGPAKKSIENFKEIQGRGVQGVVNGKLYKIGSAEFVGTQKPTDLNTSFVFVAIEREVKGYFSIHIQARKDLKSMLDRLGKRSVALLSGDNEADRLRMTQLFPPNTDLLFNQDPHDKLEYISSLQRSNKHVLMIGDGLNDAGALQQSDVGIAVSDNTASFFPASDGILSGDKIPSLDSILNFARSSSVILKTAFGISFFYNAVALTFAVTGNLTPLVAAIIMPISSISVVSFASLAVKLSSARHKF